jgi:hypothetical protein
LVRILNNRLARLKDAKNQSEANGELERIVELDLQIAETENTLCQLRSL